MRENHCRHPSEPAEDRVAIARRCAGVRGIKQTAVAARPGGRLRRGRAERQAAAGQRGRPISAGADQLRSAHGTRPIRANVQLERQGPSDGNQSVPTNENATTIERETHLPHRQLNRWYRHSFVSCP